MLANRRIQIPIQIDGKNDLIINMLNGFCVLYLLGGIPPPSDLSRGWRYRRQKLVDNFLGGGAGPGGGFQSIFINKAPSRHLRRADELNRGYRPEFTLVYQDGFNDEHIKKIS